MQGTLYPPHKRDRTLNLLPLKHPIVKKYNLDGVKVLTSAAAPLSAELTHQVARVLKNSSIGQGYGMTETTRAWGINRRIRRAPHPGGRRPHPEGGRLVGRRQRPGPDRRDGPEHGAGIPG